MRDDAPLISLVLTACIIPTKIIIILPHFSLPFYPPSPLQHRVIFDRGEQLDLFCHIEREAQSASGDDTAGQFCFY